VVQSYVHLRQLTTTDIRPMEAIEMNLVAPKALEKCIRCMWCKVTIMFVVLGVRGKLPRGSDIRLDPECMGRMYWALAQSKTDFI
jgi:hypothetical protein